MGLECLTDVRAHSQVRPCNSRRPAKRTHSASALSSRRCRPSMSRNMQFLRGSSDCNRWRNEQSPATAGVYCVSSRVRMFSNVHVHAHVHVRARLRVCPLGFDAAQPKAACLSPSRFEAYHSFWTRCSRAALRQAKILLWRFCVCPSLKCFCSSFRE